MRHTILRLDAAFLGLAGLMGLLSDLASYSLGTGPFGAVFYQNPTVIGSVEAHALAGLMAAVLWFFSRQPDSSFGNWTGMVAHLMLGVSNLIWFDVFRLVHATASGAAVTAVHFSFSALHGFVAFPIASRLVRIHDGTGQPIPREEERSSECFPQSTQAIRPRSSIPR
jgi:hypothetical protein